MDEQNNFVATGRDLSRQDATDNDTDFSLSLEEVAERYDRAGHPRTLRSLQRYCASGHLDARKIATTMGDKYLVTPQSVARHIAQIVEFAQLDAVATGRDMSRPVATASSCENSTICAMWRATDCGVTKYLSPVIVAIFRASKWPIAQ